MAKSAEMVIEYRAASVIEQVPLGGMMSTGLELVEVATK
jgi:hypothetical protein